MAKTKPVFPMYLQVGTFFCKTALVTPPKVRLASEYQLES